MGRTVKWIKSLLTGKKEREKMHRNHPSAGTNENPATPIVIPLPTPKEKRRWSFRRSSASAAGTKESNHRDNTASKQAATSPAAQAQASNLESENNAQTKEALIAAVAADAEVQADSDVVQHRAATDGKSSALEQAAAAIKIQSVYRSYLARKALRALRGLVKLQALARGHLVRKQATATLRCMQALVTVQARARAQRIRAAEGAKNCNPHWQLSPRLTNHDGNFRNSYDDTERAVEENTKIVEMDHGEPNRGVEVRNGYSNHRYNDQMDNRFASHYASQFAFSKLQDYQQAPPSPSPITDMSPRTYSGHFDDYSFATAQSSPHYYYSAISKPDPSSTPFNFSGPDYAETMSYDYPLYPSYMANTESSRAKARSQSAPKQRPEPVERQPSVRRRSSAEGRNIPRAVRMQRSSSHLGSTAQNYQYPWSVKLNKSAVSLKDSECGSTCSVRTNTNYCRSLVSFDTHTHRY